MSDLSSLAEKYILLALHLGKHQAGFIDAHYGRASELKARVDTQPTLALGTLLAQANEILSSLNKNESERARYLYRQTEALKTIIEIKEGKMISFRDEVRLSLGIDNLPHQNESELAETISEIDSLLSGDGALADRFTRWRKKFELQGDELTVFIEAAMRETKLKTQSLFDLPENDVTVSLVRDQPWAGYHWYKGNYQSLYELNIDVPTTIWGVLHTTTHEAFCGHHTEAIVKESELVKKLGYDEFSINLLGTPCSTIAEGIAEAAQQVIIGDQNAVIDWLRAHESLHHCTLTDHDADILNALEKLGRKSILNAALLMHEEHAGDDTVFKYLRRFSPSEDDLLHRTISRLRDADYRTYLLTYPIGKEIVMNELEHSHHPEKTFYNMLKAACYPYSSPLYAN
jgi:hypothetical protein